MIYNVVYVCMYVCFICCNDVCNPNDVAGLLFVDTTDVWLYDLMATTHARTIGSKYDNVYN